MSILADYEIRQRCISADARPIMPMISPYIDKQVKEIDGRRILSFGVSSFGYDVSLSDEFKLFTNLHAGVIDPKNFGEDCLHEARLHKDDSGTYVILPPNSYLLGRTQEYFNIPDDIMVVAVGKSTNARSGVIVNTTPIEPGFVGHVVIEVSNATSLPVKIYAYEGIAQFLFFQGQPCEVSYATRGGKYQGQTGITLSKV